MASRGDTTTSQPAGCELEIAGVSVVRSDVGPLEAEYALFDASEIELRATDYGAIHEVGYRTTVADALARLDAAGATSALVRELASALMAVAPKYVATSAAPVLGVLSAAELLVGDRYDGERKTYSSPVVDLARVSIDAGTAGASAALQAAGLAAWLRDTNPDAEVVLRTADYMAKRRPGERSIKRVSLSGLRALAAAVLKLENHGPVRTPPPDVSQSDLVLWLARRGAPTNRISWAEQVFARAPSGSPKGPLSDPRALAIDVLIASDRTAEAMPLIEKLEVDLGRGPAAQYLRLHASFASSAPKEVAERATALLAQEPSSELRMLAVRALTASGHAARAASLAREVLSDPHASDALKVEARKHTDVEADVVTERTRSVPTAPPPGRMRPSAPNLVLDLPRSPSPSVAEVETFSALSRRPTPPPSPTPSGAPKSSPKPFIMGITTPPRTSATATPKPPEGHVGTPSEMPTRPPAAGLDPYLFAEGRGASQGPKVEPAVTYEPPPPQGSPSSWARGASRPPFQSGPPAPALPRPPAVPHFERRAAELAETLSLPPGLHGLAVPFDAVPKSVAEARVLFTLLSRTLGRAYREQRATQLKTDLSGIEHMQGCLRERFTVAAIRSAEEASEIRSHGALLSEILARNFGAEWTDIAPSELGYWAMTTPSGLRLWPFGRVLRFVLQGHRERDLVSYYLELDARVRGPR